MSRLLTLGEVAERLGLSDTPRAVYSLPIPRSPLSPRRTRWALGYPIRAHLQRYFLNRPAIAASGPAGDCPAATFLSSLRFHTATPRTARA